MLFEIKTISFGVGRLTFSNFKSTEQVTKVNKKTHNLVFILPVDQELGE